MSLIFKGIAHPPAKQTRAHPSDLSVGELAAAQLAGLPMFVEHDTSSAPIGNVLTSFEGRRGELRVVGKIDDEAIARQVKDGQLRGLSLGTDCVQSMDGTVLSRSQKELSVCAEGRRSGTWITDIDNKTVHQVAEFSKSKDSRTSDATHAHNRAHTHTHTLAQPRTRTPCPALSFFASRRPRFRTSQQLLNKTNLQPHDDRFCRCCCTRRRNRLEGDV